MHDLAIFALNATRDFGARVAQCLGGLSAHEEREFEDGEHKARPLINVRNRDVFVVQSLYSDAQQSVNDKLCRLLFFLGALRDAGADYLTAVVPYLGYARKDAKTQPRDPVTTRYVAALFEAVGVDRVITIDVHNLAAFQNAFRCRTEHLDTAALLSRHLAATFAVREAIAVVSPDPGGLKRAERLRRMLVQVRHRDIGLAFMEKKRAAGELSAGKLVGDVAGCTAIIVDDIISTGGTLARAARVCRAQGAKRVIAAVTHGLFTGNAADVIRAGDLDAVIITDTVPPLRLPPEVVSSRVTVVSVAGLFAEAIRRLHDGDSIVELLGH